MEDLVDHNILATVRKRIEQLQDVDLFDSGQIENRIQDNRLSPFPQILNTERPDVTTSNLLEGRIAVITDGSPSVLILPTTFWSGLQAAEDYYDRYLFSIARKWVRYIMIAISLTLPSVYVALSTYNPNMLLETLMTSIDTARERIPFLSKPKRGIKAALLLQV